MRRLRGTGRYQRDYISATGAGEKLFIQYPGKESKRAGAKRRPWDFFPILTKPSGAQAADLGFTDIFGKTYDTLRVARKRSLPHVRAFAATVYRLAFMLDHRLMAPSVARLRRPPPSLSRNVRVRPANGRLPPLYIYSPDSVVLSELSCAIPKIGELTLEGFLRYCDILAWNEDSKYYYSKVQTGDAGWLGSTGRINTLLTLTRVVGLATDDVRLGDLLGGFSYGTSAASPSEVIAMTGGLVGLTE